MFVRHISKHLHVWKSNPKRKPLVLRGARQVGKTTLIKQFSINYKYSIFLNLEKSSDIHFFEKHTDVKRIVEALFISNNIPTDGIKEIT